MIMDAAPPFRTPVAAKLQGRRVLVTGGTGFLGNRLVERLALECGCEIRLLVRNFTKASRVARFPVQMIKGDVTDTATVARAAEGCDTIFHCVVDNALPPEQQREVSVKGVENTAKAALTQKARLVHVSTIAVYGQTPEGDLTEETPHPAPEDTYGQVKLAAEETALSFARKHGLGVIALQPTVIYGPYSGWSTGPLGIMANKQMVLINGGDGLCNAVYIDDVVESLLLAAVAEESALGQAYLISGDEPTTWRTYYQYYENMLGERSLIDKSATELVARLTEKPKKKGTVRMAMEMVTQDQDMRTRLKQLPAVEAVLRAKSAVVPESAWETFKRKVFKGGGTQPPMPLAPDPEADAPAIEEPPAAPEKPIAWPDMGRIDLETLKTRVIIDKARRALGYEPRFDLPRGMALTEQWLRWANFLPPR